MRLTPRNAGFALLLGLVAALALWLWGWGGADRIAHWAAREQQEVQRGLAGALRAVRGGEPWALAGLLGLCFSYGFFHAAGPGHGKLVMGGYAMGTDVPRLRLIGLTLAGSLGQAVTAILLVYAGVLVLGWGRETMTDLADGTMQAVSAGAIVLVGLWLVGRGVRKLWRARGQDGAVAQIQDHADDHHHAHHDHAHHGHTHDDHGICDTCGHAHGPTLEQVAGVRTWRDGLAVVLAVAIRPCTGALFVLILTYGMGIPLAGILGAIVMALGTALVTLTVALGAGQLRGGLAERLTGSGGLRMMAGIEIAAGAAVALISLQVMLRMM